MRLSLELQLLEGASEAYILNELARCEALGDAVVTSSEHLAIQLRNILLVASCGK